MKGYQVVIILVSLALCGVFCLKPPSVPQWDVDANVPLYHGTIRLVDMLDSSLFRVLPDSTVSFSFNFQFDTVGPGQSLDLISVDSSSRIALSDFVFEHAGSGRVHLEMLEITGMPVPDSGMKARVPPFVNSTHQQCPVDDIASAEIASGIVHVTAANNTGLAMDSVVASTPMGTVRFGPLPPGAVQSRSLDVSGTSFSAPFPLDLLFASPGTGSDTIQLYKHDSVVIAFGFDSLRLGSGRVRIPHVQSERQCQVTVGSAQPFRIDSLTLSSGMCDLAIANQFDVPIEARLQVPKLNYDQYHVVAGRQSLNVELPLAGLSMDSRGRVNSLFDFHITAVTESTGQFVDLGKRDGLDVSYHSSGLGTQMVAGEFNRPVYVATRRETLPQLVPYGLRGLRVPAADLCLDLENGIGFPMEVGIDVAAVIDGSAVAHVRQTLLLDPAVQGMPARCSFTIPLTDIINAGPDAVTFEYDVRILGAGSCQLDAFVTGRAAMSTPVRVAFAPDTIETPSRQVVLTESQREAVTQRLSGAGAELQVSNHLPVGFSGCLVIARDSGAELRNGTLVDSVVIPFGVPAGRCDRKGNCVAGSDTTLFLDLDSADVTLFRTWPLNARLRFMLPETDTVTVHAADGMSFDALLQLRVRVE